MVALSNGPNTIRITRHTVVTCLGQGEADHLTAMKSGRSGLTPSTYPDLPFDCYLGAVAGLENLQFPQELLEFDNRATRLAVMALQTDGFLDAAYAVRDRWGPDRCGLVLGTTSSGIIKLEEVYRDRADTEPLPDSYIMNHHDNYHAVAAFVHKFLGLRGPSYTVSTACSSSAKAIIDAHQLIAAGFCDAVIVGGVDSLCLLSLNGFESMQLISRQPCRPCDISRNGISVGEGAAFMIVERDTNLGLGLCGAGESSDAVSMSTPPKDGAGAEAAMRAALEDANLDPGQVSHVNLHGTATLSNDIAECNAVRTVFGEAIPVSSLKGMIGHTLGAAGAVEGVMCLIALDANLIPGNVGLQTLDPAIGCNVVPDSNEGKITHILSNAFGFGGNNCALVFGK
jgi:3-oxoacyl-[acyl-carrier-protein] synthase I